MTQKKGRKKTAARLVFIPCDGSSPKHPPLPCQPGRLLNAKTSSTQRAKIPNVDQNLDTGG